MIELLFFNLYVKCEDEEQMKYFSQSYQANCLSYLGLVFFQF